MAEVGPRSEVFRPQHKLVTSHEEVEIIPDENPLVCGLFSGLTLWIINFFSVPQGHVKFVTRFGRYIRKADPGLNACLSFWGLYQQVTSSVPTMEQILEHRPDNVLTADSMAFRITAAVFYSITDPKKAIFDVENYQEAMINLTDATLRNECGHLAARELPAAREKIAAALRSQLDEGTAPWGITVRLVEITHMDKQYEVTHMDEQVEITHTEQQENLSSRITNL